MRKLIAILLISIAGVRGPVTACPVLTEGDALAQSEKDRNEAVGLVSRALEDADLVFIARVESVDERPVPDPEREKASSGENVRLGPMINGTARLIPLRAIKGPLPGRLAVNYKRDDGVFERRCTGVPFFNVVYFQKSYRYLVYLNGNEVLRANEITDWFDGLTDEKELEILESRMTPN